jgi:predicted dinucleotide-binding enzyme
MNIAIIGAGNVGRALGRGWRKAGHSVSFGVRNPDESKYRDLSREIDVRVRTVREASRDSDVVVLATPYAACEDAIAAAGSLSGKVLVDCTNPLEPGLAGLIHRGNDSGGEQVARWAPEAKVVKAFNTTGFNIMENPTLEGRRAVMFICGDDSSARATVIELSDALGFESVDAGELQSARLLEPMALLWISAAYKFGLGRDFAFGLLRRTAG